MELTDFLGDLAGQGFQALGNAGVETIRTTDWVNVAQTVGTAAIDVTKGAIDVAASGWREREKIVDWVNTVTGHNRGILIPLKKHGFNFSQNEFFSHEILKALCERKYKKS